MLHSCDFSSPSSFHFHFITSNVSVVEEAGGGGEGGGDEEEEEDEDDEGKE